MCPDFQALEAAHSIRRYIGRRFNREAAAFEVLPQGEVVNIKGAAMAALMRKAIRNGDLEAFDAETAMFAGVAFKKTTQSKVTSK
jgi:hypothetical protein